jgi:hypothetical protein
MYSKAKVFRDHVYVLPQPGWLVITAQIFPVDYLSPSWATSTKNASWLLTGAVSAAIFETMCLSPIYFAMNVGEVRVL